MTAAPVIADDERRRRIVARHFRSGSVAEIVRDNVVLHSTDPATVYLSLRARNPELGRDDIERALYDDRSVVRHVGMRRTLFVVPVEAVAVVHAACTAGVHVRERARLVRMLEESELVTDGDAGVWLRDVEDATLAVIDERAPIAAQHLRTEVPALMERLVVPRMKVDNGLSTFVLSRLAMSGRIVRGRPRGTWVSGTYHWHTTEGWLGSSIPTLDPSAGRAELARRWLARHGPGTLDDLAWWAGWTKTQTRAALAAIGAEPVTVGDREAWVVPGDAGTTRLGDADEHRVLLLPALDGTAMGWKHRFFLADAKRPQLFDRNGNVGPTIWAGGTVIGGWGQGPGGEVRWSLLDDVGRTVMEATATAADELTNWLGGTVVSPRFPTPLQKELSRRP